MRTASVRNLVTYLHLLTCLLTYLLTYLVYCTALRPIVFAWPSGSGVLSFNKVSGFSPLLLSSARILLHVLSPIPIFQYVDRFCAALILLLRTRTCTRTRARACARTRTRTLSHSYAESHCPRTRAHAHTYTHTRTHAFLYSYSYYYSYSYLISKVVIFRFS